MITLKQTLKNISADIVRRQDLESSQYRRTSRLRVLLMRGMISVILYRFSHLCMQHRLKIVSKILFSINTNVFRNEISPHAKLGAGLVFANNGGVGITQVVHVGENCTFLGMNTLTIGAMKGFDVNHDLIELGNYCVVGTRARIMRPIKITDCVQIKHNSLVMLPESKVGSVLSGVPAKRRGIAVAADVMHFNPLKGGDINVQISNRS